MARKDNFQNVDIARVMSAMDSLSHAFNWDDSQEQGQYWSEIYNKLAEIAEEAEQKYLTSAGRAII